MFGLLVRCCGVLHGAHPLSRCGVLCDAHSISHRSVSRGAHSMSRCGVLFGAHPISRYGVLCDAHSISRSRALWRHDAHRHGLELSVAQWRIHRGDCCSHERATRKR